VVISHHLEVANHHLEVAWEVVWEVEASILRLVVWEVALLLELPQRKARGQEPS
jgi:hypothetical protein